MAKLIYSAIASLDGFIADANGRFDWAEPDAEVHTFINELERPIGTHLYGRRMYEVLAAWETLDVDGQPSHLAEFAAIWRAADKIVYSRTLDTPVTAKTKIERDFDPQAVAKMKAQSDHDISIGGPGLATHAFRAGLIDECYLFLAPTIVGGGTRHLPDDVRLRLNLLDERRFGNGMVWLRYRCST
jgi:dihydrofolate reductase